MGGGGIRGLNKSCVPEKGGLLEGGSFLKGGLSKRINGIDVNACAFTRNQVNAESTESYSKQQ